MRLVVMLLCCSFGACGEANEEEMERLARLLQWRPGSRVADVGAGSGAYALEAVRIVGQEGTVYATEVDRRKLRLLRTKQESNPTLRVIISSEKDAGLPPSCCDSVFLRGVYHHITDPDAVNASLYRALKSGGRLAIIDFTPKRLLSWFFPVRGVPANRGGHGVSPEIVGDELAKQGFRSDKTIPEWPDGQYCVLARKP